MMDHAEQQDKLAWTHTAHLLSLTYNVNRGKGKPRGWEDFYPYDTITARDEAPDLKDPEVVNKFLQMGKTLHNGN